MTAIKVGKCHKCNKSVYLDENGNSVDDYLPAGDWDWVCYPCQLQLMDSGEWDKWKEKQFNAHSGGKCQH